MKRLPAWLRNPWLWQLLVAAGLVALAIWQTDTDKIADSLSRVRPEWLLVAVVIYMTLRFMQAGVPVELHVYPGTFHGSALVVTAAVSQRQRVELIDALRRGLGAGS